MGTARGRGGRASGLRGGGPAHASGRVRGGGAAVLQDAPARAREIRGRKAEAAAASRERRAGSGDGPVVTVGRSPLR